MNNESIAIDRSKHEESVTERFFDVPNERSFADLFRVFTPQLLAFFRNRGCGAAVAEDLAQEVMLAVHLKASQLRERKLFRAWLFKIARNALSHYYRKQAAEVETVGLADVARADSIGARIDQSSAWIWMPCSTYLCITTCG